MESEKKSNNAVFMIAAAAIVICLCCAVSVCVAAGVGVFIMQADENSVQLAEPDAPLPFEEMEAPEVIPTVGLEEPFDPTIPQGGLGNNALRKRTWDFVISLAEKNADCVEPIPAATVIIVSKEPDADGVWEEAWTLFCGNGPTPVYRIIFTPNSNGTINFSPGLISK